MRRTASLATALVALVALAFTLAACGSSSTESGSSATTSASNDPDALTLYNAQHEDLMAEMVAAFTKQTGIDVNVRNGSDLEMANQIVAEGAASPAAVFVTDN